MNNQQVPDVNAFIKAIESRDFSSEEDLELLKKLNAVVESILKYAQTINNNESKK